MIFEFKTVEDCLPPPMKTAEKNGINYFELLLSKNDMY